MRDDRDHVLARFSSGRSGERRLGSRRSQYRRGAGTFRRRGADVRACARHPHVPLSASQRYRDASVALRRLGADVDAWPVPPAGLFVVEEKTVYLRSATPMTVAHEFAHGLDCALGEGVYRSGYDTAIRSAFARTSAFVTPYAATGLDEYFAESLRAYVEVNDPHSPWPKATRDRLRSTDPAMFGFVHELFTTMLRPRT